ncbi:MAG: lytic murein transglycosylase [Candidatus Moranbacteria bacterium]|nr:lytic murein transglycosylase [Candidatus Moranbacteria bacterium]
MSEYKKSFIFILLLLCLQSFGLQSAFHFEDVLAASEYEAVLEKKADLQDDISDIQKELNRKEAEKKKLEGNLNVIKGAVQSTEKAIVQTEEQIQQTEKVISRKEKEINRLNSKYEIQKKILKNLIQEMYYNSEQPLVYVALDHEDFSEMMTSFDHLLSMKDQILSIVDEIKHDKEAIKSEKEELEEVKEEHKELLEEKDEQKQALMIDKYHLEGEVQETKEDIGKLKKKLSKLNSELTKMLGKKYDVNDIEEAAKLASKKTGVRRDFIMGMLVVESDLGRYTGGCDYKQSRMNDVRKVIFKDICSELGYDYNKMKVSCPPKSYNGTGGAMGVAQFMSDTWRGYQSQIAANTGNNPPDPWSLIDGVMAMAVKLKNDGATDSKIRIINPCNRSEKIYVKGEEYASLKYLGWSCYGLTNYAKNVQYWADNYERLLK